jgi:predicted PolB exonuclease-like 3'-5' exonuclease
MWEDEIIEEIHRIREEYAKSFNYDLDAIVADLQRQQAEDGWKVVDLSKKQDVSIAEEIDTVTKPKLIAGN